MLFLLSRVWRAQKGTVETDDERIHRRSIGFVENAYSTASLVNLMLFLRNGQYRSLLERILRARLVYKEPNMSRVISFEYLNRQLVWQELSVWFRREDVLDYPVPF